MRALLIVALIYWISNRVSKKEEPRKTYKTSKQFSSYDNDSLELDVESELDRTSKAKREISLKDLESFDLKDLTGLFFEEDDNFEDETDKSNEVEPVITSENSMENKPETSRRSLPRMEFELEGEVYRDPSVSKESSLNYSKKQMREDIVKGFIFSEIIKEPKSIKNKNESI